MNDELIERLRAHAEAHEYIANADHEQKQWMHDLYDAADAIESLQRVSSELQRNKTSIITWDTRGIRTVNGVADDATDSLTAEIAALRKDLYDAADAIEAYGQPVVLDEDALNKACWAFIDGWRRHTEQKMSGHTWNNLKPIVRATLMKYIDEARPRHPK